MVSPLLVIDESAIFSIINEINILIKVGMPPINLLNISDNTIGKPRENIDKTYSLPKLNLVALFGISPNSATTNTPRKNPPMLNRTDINDVTYSITFTVGAKRYESFLENDILSPSVSSL